jgi:hypothetical protein
MYIHKVILLYSITSATAFMFQGNCLLHRTFSLHMSSVSSVQSLAPKVLKQTETLHNRNVDISSNEVILSRSKRMVKTVPSGQVQIPIHIRIAKVSNRKNIFF